ncbi:MAG: polysaccharide deacetylase family protein [Firmicutes bacterium]|nr:polysaccharide deacetylase family protein [Bacillota bacterium]
MRRRPRAPRGSRPSADPAAVQGGGALARLLAVALLVAAVALAVHAGTRLILPGLLRLTRGPTVARGVWLEAGEVRVELGGLGREEVLGVLEDAAPALSRPPVDARLDPATKGVLPALEGRRLDVAATLEAAFRAPAGGRVNPVFYAVPPAVSLDDFADRPIYRGLPDKGAVALVLNVAWGDEHLDRILALVEEAGGRLTVCPVGAWLEGDEGRARWLAAAAARGHEVGNHGYYNRPMTYAEEQVAEEILRTGALIERACGLRPLVFAPPMGAFTESTLKAAARLGYRTVLWSLDTVDWRLEGVDVIARRLARAEAGDIILCHPTAQTAPALEQSLPGLATKGLRLVTLSELLSPALPPLSQGIPSPEGG